MAFDYARYNREALILESPVELPVNLLIIKNQHQTTSRIQVKGAQNLHQKNKRKMIAGIRVCRSLVKLRKQRKKFFSCVESYPAHDDKNKETPKIKSQQIQT